jgi:hypothetical protein
MSVLPGARDTIGPSGFLIRIKKNHRALASSETFFCAKEFRPGVRGG